MTVTLGLPIVRTSVDHGTAFDIAWRGEADPQSMIEALHLAAQMASERKEDHDPSAVDEGYTGFGARD